MPDVVLVNPWIYDFAAYDLWAKPLGLLRLGALLRARGYEIALLDALDPFHPELPQRPKRKAYGTGHYFRQKIPKPWPLADVPRNFARYGLPPNLFLKELKRLGKPQVFVVTSLMTYWYPGVVEAVRLLRRLYPDVPVLVGGIYVTLCPEHAQKILPEAEVIPGGLERVLKAVEKRAIPSGSRALHPYPAFDLYRSLPYVVIASSFGCPFRCRYCASRLLNPSFSQRPPKEVVAEITFWHERFGVKDFAFYDDALLVNFERHLAVILEEILRLGLKVRFHTPNALHVRLVRKDVARLLRQAGFVTIRFGFETANPERHRQLDGKVEAEELAQTLAYMREAGFERAQLGVYLLWGLPEQDFSEVLSSAAFVSSCRGTPYLAEYSPIPGTSLYEEARRLSRYPLDEDPLFHNNTAFPCLPTPDWEAIEEVKRRVRALRREA